LGRAPEVLRIKADRIQRFFLGHCFLALARTISSKSHLIDSFISVQYWGIGKHAV